MKRATMKPQALASKPQALASKPQALASLRRSQKQAPQQTKVTTDARALCQRQQKEPP